MSDDRIVRWTGNNFDEITRLVHPNDAFPPSLTAYGTDLTISQLGKKARVRIGDCVSRGALGELNVFPVVPEGFPHGHGPDPDGV